ncbi:MAG TPA: hypothetical protein VEA61_06870 [Allosphingosinicella sp.]|nr:hypothetical protein [Allosphingosinicella sp.]
MVVTFYGWAGDQTTPLPGRKPLQALVALQTLGPAHSLGDTIKAVAEMSVVPDAIFKISPVVEGRAPALPVKISWGGPLFWVIDFEISEGDTPWPPGVNLVHVTASSFDPKLPEDEKWSASTFATVIVPPLAKQKAPSPQKARAARKRPGRTRSPSGRGT